MREEARRLVMLGRFELLHGGCLVKVPTGGQRLLAFLAVSEGPQRRDHVAWTLWAGHSEARASASLRTALWRLPRPGGRALFTDNDNELELAADIEIDWRGCAAAARDIIDSRRRAEPEIVEALRADLLPTWYEEWLGPEQERYRQLRLHALEAASQRLLADGLTFDALCAGLAAVASEPLRESAHRCVIAAHIAEGNTFEATRQCDSYLEHLAAAGLRPRASDALWALLSEPFDLPSEVLIHRSAGAGTNAAVVDTRRWDT